MKQKTQNKLKLLKLSTIEKTSDGYYFVSLTDGSKGILPKDNILIKEFKKAERETPKRLYQQTK